MELTEKYRPKTFDEVLGQESVIASLKSVIKDGKLPACLLFTGDPGLGKTSIARLVAAMSGSTNVTEINGANHTGIDGMRDVVEQLNFLALGPNKNKVIILDEAHRLSKQAWDSLLKPIEEPGPHSWILCSTEPSKIPKSILSRCVPPTGYQLKKVDVLKIRAFLNTVVTTEDYTIDKNIVNLIAMSCEGSPRQALKYLEALQSEKDLQKAKEIVKSINIGEASPIINLARLLVNKCTFVEALEAARDIEDDILGVRYGINAYVAKCVIGSKSLDQTKYLMQILHTFKDPWDPSDKLAPLLLALGTLLID